MKNIIYIPLLFLGLLFTSCKKESLQSYLVESQEKKEFSHISIPSSIIQLSSLTASEEEQKAFESINKINITGLLINNASEGQYEIEKKKLKNILKGSDYKTLMNFKDKGNNITLYYTGETDAIDEIIAFGYGEKMGVGVARVLGKKMNPSAITKMLKNTKLDKNSLSKFKMIFDGIK